MSHQRQQQHQRSGEQQHISTSEHSSFQSLPWEEIVLSQQQQQQHHHQQKIHQRTQDPLPPNMTSFAHEQKKKQHDDQHDMQRRHKGSSSGSSGKSRSGWFSNPKKSNSSNQNTLVNEESVKQNGHWLLKEKSPMDQMQSMPPIGTLRDSGIGDDGQQPSGKSSTERSGPHLSRSGTSRSSFGIILRDKFQKNPNVYFPNTSKSGSSQRSMEDGDDLEDNHEVAGDVSDTDTLIHNMSEGSFEKDASSSLTSAGSKASSGNCSSLSPHNSMEGSPRMNPAHAIIPSISNPGVSLGKKTIRNYTPKESSNMLKELEKQRNNAKAQAAAAAEVRKQQLLAQQQKKTSVERMIDDFHRNLPPPSINGAQSTVESLQQAPIPLPALANQGLEDEEEEDEVVPHHISTDRYEDRSINVRAPSTIMTSSSATKRAGSSKHGTMSSQVSNWSAASSVASFDYQPAGAGGGRRKVSTSTENKSLPALTEVDYGERIPPDGASSDSPPPFVQRIEVKAEINKNRPKTSTSSAKKKKVLAGEDISDLLEGPNQSEEDDGFSNLRKLLSEGRITGLNDKPPSFIPPTPPATAKPVGSSSPKGGSGVSTPASKKVVPSNSSAGEVVKKKLNSSAGIGDNSAPSSAKKRAKPPAPKPARSQSQSNISRTTNLEKQPSRKSKEAPKPPGQGAGGGSSSEGGGATSGPKALVNGNDVKFLSSKLRESVEDLTQMDARRRAAVRGANAEIKRSPSNHETKTSKFIAFI